MADPPAPHHPSVSRRRLFAAFTAHLPLKATAVFLAVILWFVVNAKEPQLHLVARILSVRTVKATIAFPDSLPHLVDIDTVGFGPVRARPPQVKVQLKSLPRP